MILDDIRSAHRRVLQAKQAYLTASGDHRNLITLALSEGVKVTEIAEALGVSRERVYQLKRDAVDSQP